MKKVRLNAALIVLAIFTVAVISAFHVQNTAQEHRQRTQEAQTLARRKQICEAEIEDRVVIRDIIDFAIPASAQANPYAKAFRERVYARLQVPPTICKGTGVNVGDVIHE